MNTTEPFIINSCKTDSNRHPDGLWCNLYRCPSGTYEEAGNCQKCSVSGCLKCDLDKDYCDETFCAPGLSGFNSDTITSQPEDTYQQCLQIGLVPADPSYGPKINDEDIYASTKMVSCFETNCENCSYDYKVC